MGKYDDLKGDKVRFVKGTHIGRDAWINITKMDKGKRTGKVHLIIDIEDEGEKRRAVSRNSVHVLRSKCESYEEAILAQHQDIETEMIHLAIHFAQCGIQSKENACRIFHKELVLAEADQAMAGSRARWRHVDWE